MLQFRHYYYDRYNKFVQCCGWQLKLTLTYFLIQLKLRWPHGLRRRTKTNVAGVKWVLKALSMSGREQDSSDPEFTGVEKIVTEIFILKVRYFLAA